jgi:hypothetical protein
MNYTILAFDYLGCRKALVVRCSVWGNFAAFRQQKANDKNPLFNLSFYVPIFCLYMRTAFSMRTVSAKVTCDDLQDGTFPGEARLWW